MDDLAAVIFDLAAIIAKRAAVVEDSSAIVAKPSMVTEDSSAVIAKRAMLIEDCAMTSADRAMGRADSAIIIAKPSIVRARSEIAAAKPASTMAKRKITRPRANVRRSGHLNLDPPAKFPGTLLLRLCGRRHLPQLFPQSQLRVRHNPLVTVKCGFCRFHIVIKFPPK